jgi:ABC-2 type transport system ATP-binding protein
VDREIGISPADAGELAVSVRGLVMSYGEFQAVRGIDLEVRRGEIFALLGPNGAGKTSTIEMLEGFRRRDAGTATVLGEDPEHGGGEWRKHFGVVLQDSEPERELTVRECIELYSGYYESPRPVDETLALVGLEHKAGTRSARLSGGEQRRLDVALALAGDPELVFLDEPTTGFDPSARRLAWSVIIGLRALNKTVLLTTHYMEEAEALADRIAVLAEGRIVAEGTPETIGGRDRAPLRITFTLPKGVSPEDLPLPVDGIHPAGNRVHVVTDAPMRTLNDLSGWALGRGLELGDIDVGRPSLEDVYLELTGEAP